ncbi:DNA ligase D [Hansschlegelia zhihuaiae]|uniref:DNA ligase (ATP) n=1 Tax=Hansschlegelia zhihuaiae TaxID=405005 RepID=A0A4Q0MH40_9HYPH|nr:DNA ligase D [Hansschlegelia zhihuaiae]RXF72810.1 DNA ligase D [Hansschlegelia zhihuaiae]
MALETYRRKRDFKKTSEPSGSEAALGTGDGYLIQKHDATRLHYDLRLEMDGVLKSWAVTKGPSLVPGEKRLAVHVEDHPIEYGTFEGTIPKGEYGGGTVILWDRGSWSPIGDPARGYKKGHLEFELHGEKLHGRWHLVRMAGKRGEKRENWLLIKGDDKAARGEADPDILEERPESVKTGRLVEEVAGESPGWSSKTGRIGKKQSNGSAKGRTAAAPQASEPAGKGPRLDPAKIRKSKAGDMPGFVAPTLATLAPKAPAGSKWIHEIKFDGYRLLARIERGEVRLLTRSGLDWTHRFGKAVVEVLRGLPVETAMIDGELIVENASGASDFSALQEALSEGRPDHFVFYVFDLLYLDGYDLRASKLIDRKEALARLVEGAGPTIKLSEHFEENGDLVLQHACRLSLEGVVSKDRDGPYVSGRGRGWIKSKCSHRQEFVIGGYAPSSVTNNAIGSLALGAHEDGKLEHVGRVGTGFSVKVSKDLFQKLQPIETKKSPFAGKLTADEARGLRFVRPELVAEIEFRAWTGDHHLRHAAFRGLREDKPAEEVARETAPETGAPSVAAPQVKLTHPDRVYWPESGVTKQGLADYYMEVWPRIAPFVVGRPLALLRCPGGVTEQCFFQKHAWKGMNRHIGVMKDPTDDEPLLTIDSREGLLGLVQGGVLEIHPWGSTNAALEKPDMIIMDLDPGEGVEWTAIIDAAREVARRLEAAGLKAFVKTSGGKGLHVVAPLKPRAEWPEVKAFAKAVADSMAADEPDRYVATVSKAKRRGKILVDYLRNGRGATAVAPYSTRARPGAAVSAPLAWDELGPEIGPAHFTVDNMPTRLAALPKDPWEDFRAAAAPLKAALAKKTRKAN